MTVECRNCKKFTFFKHKSNYARLSFAKKFENESTLLQREQSDLFTMNRVQGPRRIRLEQLNTDRE